MSEEFNDEINIALTLAELIEISARFEDIANRQESYVESLENREDEISKTELQRARIDLATMRSLLSKADQALSDAGY